MNSGKGMNDTVVSMFMGRNRTGLGTVLSTISGTPCACAVRAIAPMSQILPGGIANTFAKIPRVVSSIRAAISSARSLAFNLASMSVHGSARPSSVCVVR